MIRLRQPSTLGLLFAPLPATAMGLFLMARGGVGVAVWLQNLIALLIGLGLSVFAIRRADGWTRAHARRWVIPVGVVTLLATLPAPGLAGVHRWLPVGPVRLHVAALLLPAMLVVFRELPLRSSLTIAITVVGILFIQPDLGQAAAFAAGWSILSLLSRGRGAIPGVVAVLAIAAATALRSDPLEPVPHVEGILDLAFAHGTSVGLLSVLFIGLIPLAFLLAPNRIAGIALAVYLAATFIAGYSGNFPIPILGYGMSPILGYYGSVAVLSIFSHRAHGDGSGREPAAPFG